MSASSLSTSDSDSPPPSPLAASSSPTLDLEFCCTADDAWYNVRVLLEEDKLTVKYLNFGDEEDEAFDPSRFESLIELELFKERFRPVSSQLQDRECGKVVPGTLVCASHSVSDSDVRFYDAVVDDVIYKDHAFANGEEECLCTFVVVWQHGPRAGCVVNKRIEHLCLVLSGGQIDPVVPIFFEKVRERLKGDMPRLLNNCDTCKEDNAAFPVLISQETKCNKLALTKIFPMEDRITSFSECYREDIDIGGADGLQLLLIDNVDKELSSSTIVEFIHRQTSVSVQAYVFPSLSFETYTKGAIFLDSKKDLQKLREFFDSPNHIVISSRGRPWVLAETFSGLNMLDMQDWMLMLEYQDKLHHISTATDKELKVVHMGSGEYNTAKKLRELFIEFATHQRKLHKRLVQEETSILQASNGV